MQYWQDISNKDGDHSDSTRMSLLDLTQLDVFILVDVIWLATSPVGLPSYDFPFQTFFACRRPWQRPGSVTAVGRFGASADYAELYRQLAAAGIVLVHSPAQQALASELPAWYPLLRDLTPRSAWFTTPPTAGDIEQAFTWPVFLKGSRQTSKHQAALSIVRSPAEYEAVVEQWRRDPILRWQQLVCREFVDLRPVPAPPVATLPPAFEFRTFWWRGQCVGAGPYWAAFTTYTWTKSEERAALALAHEAARRLAVPFLVVDVAQTTSGDWIVIECNDGQESGYAGIAPVALWQNVVEIERRHAAGQG